MHNDESRPRSEVRDFEAKALLSDSEKLVNNYLGLQERNNTLQRDLAKAKKAQASSETRATSLAKEKLALQKEIKSLTRRLGSAHGALNAYRAESKELKSNLANLRGSKTMRAGRLVLAPLTATRNFVSRKPTSNSQPENAKDNSVDDTGTESKPVEKPQKINPVRLTTDELRALVSENPSVESVSWLLTRLWYTEGSISESAELLANNHELVEELGPKQAALATRVNAHFRLQETPLEIPPRSLGTAYVAEPGRLMYCVHSTPVFNSNGYSTRTMGIASGMKEAGVDLHVVARPGYPWDTKADKKVPAQQRYETQVNGTSYVHRPGVSIERTPLDHYILGAADSYVQEALLQRPSMIQAASNFITAMPALIAARRLGIPFVYEVRGLWEITEASKKADGWKDSERHALTLQMETTVAREADYVLAITPQVRDVLVERGIPQDKIAVVPNGVDPNQFLPLPKDTKFAKSRKISRLKPVIGFAGSMVEYEGLQTLLEASQILTERDIDHQVVIAGSGNAAAGLKAQAKKLGNTKALFLGRLPIATMPRLMSTFDIVACPRLSQEVTELVSPLKPLESFASGKPTVLSDVSPHVDLAGAGDEQRAALFKAGDSEALADTLETLIADPAKRELLGKRARLWCLDERKWSSIAQQIKFAHAQARSHHDASAGATHSMTLSDLRIGIIADEFTTKTLGASISLLPLKRKGWRKQLDETHVDAVFIESAWSGNDGAWHRGVGYYSKEESADLRGLLAHCADKSIPTLFWNKEDPVHFNRFVRTAGMCNYVFTTDGNMVVPYLENGSTSLKSAAAMPFYAQPLIHNPLPSKMPFSNSVAYAGTYYGERYATRSRQLYRMLLEAQKFGLEIYDRQLAYENSPYHFPREFRHNVKGVLPYDKVLDSYKSHSVQLNVNSVADSPTMFSRRVVEIAASGGVVLSGPGRGIRETFGSNIPESNENLFWQAMLREWTTNPVSHKNEAWRQMRTVYRSHTIDTAMTIALRTAGLPVSAPQLDSYQVVVESPDDEVVASLTVQSVLPSRIVCDAKLLSDESLLLLSQAGIDVLAEPFATPAPIWTVTVSEPVHRTWAEDYLLSTKFGKWNSISSTPKVNHEFGDPLARKSSVRPKAQNSAFPTFHRLQPLDDGTHLSLAFPSRTSHLREAGTQPTRSIQSGKPQHETVLFAGHDFKFAQHLIQATRDAGYTVLEDKWDGHAQHDEETSKRLIDKADIIFCEWGLGNAVWYSKHKRPGQRLIVRVHAQEIRVPHLANIQHANVDQYIFVSELMRTTAIVSHGVPASKASVIPNGVDLTALNKPKPAEARFNIGFVGFIPQSKRLDRALDFMESLLSKDPRYRLFIRGKTVEDYPWMKDRPEELAYYEEQFQRAKALNEKYEDAVTFDPYGPDMAEWYTKVGVVLSTSDHESFHLTIADGAASGARPLCLSWPGADLIYPREWLYASTEDMVNALTSEPAPDTENFRAYAEEKFDQLNVIDSLLSTINGNSTR